MIYTTEFPELKLFKRGKVRDIYEFENELLIVATDRISCFDVVLPTPIPSKGKILTKLSCFWFSFTKEIISNHLITSNVEDFPQEVQKYREILKDRSMLVKKSKVLPIECVVRGYLSGSAFEEYKKTMSICGIKIPSGLIESDKLPEPIFTPATKATTGHDINITESQAEDIIGKQTFQKIKEKSFQIYEKASQYAESKGIIIADTKFEFGIYDNELILVDEILTPDSSRFWPKDEYKPGGPQVSFDKQFVRDYLEGLDWDKRPPAPELPKEIVDKTSEKYHEALFKFTGQKL